MPASAFHLFETTIGSCGIAWSDAGISGLQLPEASVQATRRRMRERFPSAVEAAPPPALRRTVERIRRLLKGRADDLRDLELDLHDLPPFRRRVYEAARDVSAGRTATYGELAKLIGAPKSARAVGQALGRNPFPIVVPCHRILASGGKPGGFTAEGGVATKKRMLEIEGAAAPGLSTIEAADDPSFGRAAKSARAAAAKQPKHKAGKPMSKSSPPAPNSSQSATGSPQLAKSRKPLFAAARGEEATAARAPLDLTAAVRFLAASDPVMAGLIERAGPCRLDLKNTQSVFGALSEAIVYQQLTGKAAATIHGRVCALFPRAKNGFGPRHILDASDEALRGCGLSGAKLASLRDLAQKTAARELPTLDEAHALDDDEIIERLTVVRGIGRWTVEMLLIFRLGRPDVLPVDDYGVRKGYAAAYRKRDLPSPKELAKLGERWKPYRSVASWYLWRAADEALRRSKPAAKASKALRKTESKKAVAASKKSKA